MMATEVSGSAARTGRAYRGGGSPACTGPGGARASELPRAARKASGSDERMMKSLSAPVGFDQAKSGLAWRAKLSAKGQQGRGAGGENAGDHSKNAADSS